MFLQTYVWGKIEQCLRDGRLINEFEILSTRRGKSWTFHLVSIPEEQFHHRVKVLMNNMVTDDYWYAHFFRGEELVVVYRDAVFHISTEPATWESAVEHGLKNGIPKEQLDFNPRTLEDAKAFFGMPVR